METNQSERPATFPTFFFSSSFETLHSRTGKRDLLFESTGFESCLVRPAQSTTTTRSSRFLAFSQVGPPFTQLNHQPLFAHDSSPTLSQPFDYVAQQWSLDEDTTSGPTSSCIPQQESPCVASCGIKVTGELIPMPPFAPPRTKAFGSHHRKSIIFDVNQEISVREARHAQILVEEHGIQRDAWYAVE